MSEERREDTPDAVAGPGQAQTQAEGAADAKPQGLAPYAQAGEAFTAWFNERVRRLPSPTLMLGTKRALALKLHPDGRLECVVETEALEPELHFVAFEAGYLDQLVRKIAAIGL